ncbi:phosphoserine aminotransferase [Rufibacter sp. DG15C]|uniref:aminotransferase class V-fold PLP-dependent enzyme n=1 Tax=Rufibacter sp. DG15C TaxID=1379909 RepID=UPI00078EB375|nr:aminotransferase class V-fold PLP-dependent enzyme [Rufibacter sp. DG15C]AMM50615.1 phosphoserine aminotransferase [Rufibacter sp. DG15C]
MASVYFTPGPAQLYPTVERHLQQALDNQVLSQSHRSQGFKELYKRADTALKELFQLPAGYAIYFTGSATEIWERSLQSLTANTSFHLVNGSFSMKYLEHAQWLGREADAYQVPFGEGFDMAQVHVPTQAELIGIAQNETSSGVCTPVSDIHALKARYPEPLLSVDMVSGAPYAQLDFNLVDTAFFSVQKGFGLPAGLGVWLVNEKCLAKAASLQGQQYTGGHHSIAMLHEFYQQFQTPCTPNVLAIYLLTHVVEDMLAKGIDTIRKETEVKAEMVYNFLEESELFQPFVQEPAHRSPTVIVAEVKGKPASDVISKLKEQGLVLGSGYGKYKDQHVRIANFPAVSEADMERLVKALRLL